MTKAVSTGYPLRTWIGTAALALMLGACGSPEQKAQTYYERGMELIAKGDDLNARLELLNAVKYQADRADVWRALAGIDERTKANSLFLDLRRIVELDPTDLNARLKLARIMLAGGAVEAASKVIELAREGDTPNAELHALKAAVLARSNDLAGAMREANRALAIEPKNVDAVTFLASRKLAEGDADAALKMLDTLNVDPKEDSRVAQLRVQILVRKGDLKGAEQGQRVLMAANPKDGNLRLQLVQILVAERRFDDAEKELRARAEAEPADLKLGLDLVRFLNSAKGSQAARAELERRIKSGGEVFDYQLALSEIDLAEGKPDDAIKLLQGVVSATSAADRKAAAQLKLAEIYISRRDFAAAEPLIGQIVAADRRNAGALRLRASLKIDRGQIDEAVADLREALNDQPKSADLLSLLAVAYERGGKLELAERQYADALKSSGDLAVALRYVAFLQRKGDAGRAEDVLSDVATRNPGNVQALSALAQVRLSRQNWAGARLVADAVAKNPDSKALAEEIRAASYAGENKTAETIAALEAAHRAAPDAVQPVTALVTSYLQEKQTAKAASLVQDMRTKFPDNAQLLVLSARVNLADNKTDEALKNFKAAVAGQPKDPVGYTALSEFYSRQKNFPAAIEVIQAAMREQPGNPTFRMALAGLLIQKGDEEAAMAEYEAILKQQPDQIVAVNNLVSLMLDRRTDKASIDRAIGLADALKAANVPQFQDTYGWAQYKKGNYPAAVQALERAIVQMGDQASVRYHLGMSYKDSGAVDKANEQFKIALGLENDESPLKAQIRAALGTAR